MPSIGIAGFFDLTFERYITPWVVRVTWVSALVLSALWAVVLVTVLGASVLTEDADTQTSSQRPGATHTEFRLPSVGSSTSSPSSSRVSAKGIAYKVASIASIVCGVILFLLWIRVALETIIVVFNIATTLTSIEGLLGNHN
jgi:hypothetical protein